MTNHSLSVTLIFVQDILGFCQKIRSNNYWRVPYSTTLDPLGATNPLLNWFFVLLFLFRTLYPQMLLVCFQNLPPQGSHSKIANYPQDIVSLILSLSFFILSLVLYFMFPMAPGFTLRMAPPLAAPVCWYSVSKWSDAEVSQVSVAPHCCPRVGRPIGPVACQSVAVPGPQRSENCLTTGVETGFSRMWLLNKTAAQGLRYLVMHKHTGKPARNLCRRTLLISAELLNLSFTKF